MRSTFKNHDNDFVIGIPKLEHGKKRACTIKEKENSLLIFQPLKIKIETMDGRKVMCNYRFKDNILYSEERHLKTNEVQCTVETSINNEGKLVEVSHNSG